MINFYYGNLPQGASIVYCLEPKHRYILPQSQTLCFPFTLPINYNQVVIDVANTTPFETAFIPSIKCWASQEPVGISITGTTNSSLSTVNPPVNGVKFNFWSINYINQITLVEANINQSIDPTLTYYMNIQNLANKINFFWFRLTYYGVDETIKCYEE